MTFTWPGLILLIVIAAICGAIGKALAGGSPGGLIRSTALGLVGALLGPWVAQHLHLSEPLVIVVGGHPFPIVCSIVGSALFVAMVYLVFGRRRSRGWST